MGAIGLAALAGALKSLMVTTAGEKGFFLSYASDDRKDFARKLTRALEDRDANVVADFRIVEPGRKYARVIFESLRQNLYTILCITPAFLRKYQDSRSMIAREVQLAMSLSARDPRRRVLPLSRGVDPHAIARVIPALAPIHVYEIEVDDDGLADAANKILIFCGLAVGTKQETRRTTVRTSYGTFLRAARIGNAVHWAADTGRVREVFTVEFLPSSDESLYQQVRLRHEATGLYLAQSEEPTQSLLTARSEAGPLTAFTIYTSEGAIQLRSPNGKLVDMEPETGRCLLCADANRRADAAGFSFLPQQGAAVAATQLASGAALAIVAQNFLGHLGVLFREKGRWLPWIPLPPPRKRISRIDVAGGERSVLVLVTTGDTVFAARVSPDTRSSPGAAVRWKRLIGVKPGEFAAIPQPAERWLLAACMRGRLVGAEWNATRARPLWREIAEGGFQGPVLLAPAGEGGALVAARRGESIVVVDIVTGRTSRVRNKHPASTDLRPAALAWTDASRVMLVVVNASMRAWWAEFAIGETPVLKKFSKPLAGRVHVFRRGDRERMLVASHPGSEALCMQRKAGGWTEPMNLGGIWLSAIAACRDEGNAIRVFAEGLDGVIFTKRFDGVSWPQSWSRLKAPPPLQDRGS